MNLLIDDEEEYLAEEAASREAQEREWAGLLLLGQRTGLSLPRVGSEINFRERARWFVANYSESPDTEKLLLLAFSGIPGITMQSLRNLVGPAAEHPQSAEAPTLRPTNLQPAQDLFDRFLSDCTTSRAGEHARAVDLYKQLEDWLAQEGEIWVPSKNKMAHELKIRGFQPARKRLKGSNPQTVYTGLCLHSRPHTCTEQD